MMYGMWSPTTSTGSWSIRSKKQAGPFSAPSEAASTIQTMNSSPSAPQPQQPSKLPLPERADTAQEESPSVIDLSKIPLEEQMKWDSDYLPENRAKLESVILNPAYRDQAPGPDR
jgi:hypothetical protein